MDLLLICMLYSYENVMITKTKQIKEYENEQDKAIIPFITNN